MFEARQRALNALDNELSSERELINECFDMTRKLIAIFDTPEFDPLMAAAGTATLKCRYLLLGVYELSLDGLGQEAGALLRVVQEYLIVIEYLYWEPEKAVELVEGKVGNAGKLAMKLAELVEGLGPEYKAIKQAVLGHLNAQKNLRENYLHTFAAHMSFAPEARGHLIDAKTLRARLDPVFAAVTFRWNLSACCSFLIDVIFHAAQLLQKHNKLPAAYAEQIQLLQERNSLLFEDLMGTNAES